MGVRLAAALAVLLVSEVAPAAAELSAERIDAENAAVRRLGGPVANGGIGDWALGNGTICAVVSDLSHESALHPQGGDLVDVGHCGRADDQWNSVQPFTNFRQGQVPPIDSMRAEVDAHEARIVAEGSEPGLHYTTTWALDLEVPTALRIETVIERVAPGERFFAFSETFFHPNSSLRAFTLDTSRPDLSPGFAHPAAEGDSIGSFVRAMVTADVHVLVGQDAVGPGIAYGLQLASARRERADGTSSQLPHISLSGEGFSTLGVFARPFWIGGGPSIGYLELAQMVFMDLDVGDRMVLERKLWVGRRADVASVTDQIFSDAPRVSGRVDDPSARLHVDLAQGGSVTQVRPAPDGSFSFRAPSGSYNLRVWAPGGRQLERAFAIDGSDLDLGTLRVGQPARVLLPSGTPMRLVFVGLDGTPAPRFGDDGLGLRFGDQEIPSSLIASDVSLAGVPGDPTSVAIPAGRYRVFATRGPEFELGRAELDIGPGASVPLVIEAPQRALETPGWISADMHVHAAGSFDSRVPLAERVRTFVAQGGDVLVATEHDNVIDFTPVIAAMGLQDVIASVPGVEITSSGGSEAAPHTFGHVNAFPLPLRPHAYRGGALSSEGVRLRRPIAELRALGGERVLQLNHPRRVSGAREDGAFLSHLSVAGEPFDPTLPLAHEPNHVLLERDPDSGLRDLDFDAIELLNGPSLEYYRIVRGDWFSLLLQGEVRTGTANSDSHRVGELVALPRSYVRVPDDAIEAFDGDAFGRAVRAGRVFGTTGPLIEVRLGEAGLGDRYTGREGVLRIQVRAASWVPVNAVRVYVNGALVVERPIERNSTLELPLDFETDAFVTVEVSGEPDDVFSAIAPEATPFAYTNPIFVDADGDGSWTPPGLPDPLPPTIFPPVVAESD